MGIAKQAFTVGGFTGLSRVAGYLRECIMAACLGACVYSDALILALKIANTFRRIFAEGAFNASFLPRFSNIVNKEDQNAANKVLSDVFVVLLIALSIFSLIVIYFFPSILKVWLRGFDELSEKFGLTVKLGRICFPYLILISLSSLFAGVLNTINKFALPAALHSLLSVFTGGSLLISYLCGNSKYISVHIMAYGALMSGLLQSYILFRAVKKYGFSLKLNLHCWTPEVKDIMKNMIPGIIGTGIWQLNMLVDTAIASYFPSGTITCVNLADRLNQFPLGTLGVSLSTVLLPALSKYIAVNDLTKTQRVLERGLSLTFFLTIFSTAILASMSELIVSIAFQRGLFDIEQVVITSCISVGFAIGLPFYVLAKVYSTVYFAAHDTKTPVIFAGVSVALNIIFLITLVPFFKYFGLALCPSLAAIFNTLLLIYFAQTKVKINYSKQFFIKIFTQLIGGVAVYFFADYVVNSIWSVSMGRHSSRWLIFLAVLLSSFIIFVAVISICMKLCGLQDWKFWRKSIQS